MSRTSSTSTTVKKKTAKRGRKPAAATPAPTAGRRRGRPAGHFDVGALIAEVRGLRNLRDRYQDLLKEHNGLLGTLKNLSSELGTSARKAWSSYRTGGAGPAASTMGSRARTSSDQVDAQYNKLLAALPSAWTSKQDICRAAGVDPHQANTAFRRLVTGFKRDGKNHPPKLESNGKRGTEGRYRKK